MIRAAAVFIVFLSAFGTISATQSCQTECIADAQSREHLDKIVDQYHRLWNGEYQLLNTTINKQLSFFSDRIPNPSGNGSIPTVITTGEGYLEIVKWSRMGFSNYTIVADFSVSHGQNIAIRWRLEGTMGEGFAFPPTTLKSGDKIEYAGIDFMRLNNCTGLVSWIHMAQDLVTYYNALGLTSITV